MKLVGWCTAALLWLREGGLLSFVWCEQCCLLASHALSFHRENHTTEPHTTTSAFDLALQCGLCRDRGGISAEQACGSASAEDQRSLIGSLCQQFDISTLSSSLFPRRRMRGDGQWTRQPACPCEFGSWQIQDILIIYSRWVSILPEDGFKKDGELSRGRSVEMKVDDTLGGKRIGGGERKRWKRRGLKTRRHAVRMESGQKVMSIFF